MTRHIALEGVDNFRDFGDYPAAGGRRLRRGALYRSASHSRATDADLARLAALEIAVVVDLRRREEREREPSRRPANFAGMVIANDVSHDEDSWHSHIASAELTAQVIPGLSRRLLPRRAVPTGGTSTSSPATSRRSPKRKARC